MNQNQPTRTPPTEPGDWEFTCDDKTSALNGGVYRVLAVMDGCNLFCKFFDESSRYCKWPVVNFPMGYWRRAEPLEPFAPKLPVVELWGEYVVVEIDGKVRVLNEHGCLWSGKRDDLKRALPTAKRTHVCKWEAADET